jgi:hypothetical protein
MLGSTSWSKELISVLKGKRRPSSGQVSSRPNFIPTDFNIIMTLMRKNRRQCFY